MAASTFPSLDQAKLGVSFVHTSSLPALQPFSVDYSQGDRGSNEVLRPGDEGGRPMDLHRFWDGVITTSQNLTRLRNEATLRNRQDFSGVNSPNWRAPTLSPGIEAPTGRI